FGFLHVAGLIGGIIGGLSMGLFNKIIRTHLLIVYSFLLSGILLACFSFLTNYLIALPLFALITFSLTVANISLNTIQVILIPEEFRGRISSTFMALNVMLIPLINI